MVARMVVSTAVWLAAWMVASTVASMAVWRADMMAE
jgi:hypothetical protein